MLKNLIQRWKSWGLRHPVFGLYVGGALFILNTIGRIQIIRDIYIWAAALHPHLFQPFLHLPSHSLAILGVFFIAVGVIFSFASKKQHPTRPKLVLETTTYTGKEWPQHPDAFLFFIHNIGARPSSFISIEPIKSKSKRYTLKLTSPDVVNVGHRPPLQFEVLEHHPQIANPEAEPARLYKEMLLQFFLDRSGKTNKSFFDVVIRSRDTDGSEITDKMRLEWSYPSLRLKVLPPT